MTTFVLNSQNGTETLNALVQQASGGDIQICDESGRVLAYLTSAQSYEDKLYAEAEAEALAHTDLLSDRSKSNEWLTTEELCRRVGMPYHGRPPEAG